MLLALVLGFCLDCHRAVEPFDPDEEVEAPDLSQIFPRGSEGTREGPPPDLAALPDPAGAAPDPSILGEVQLADEVTAPAGGVLFVVARSSSGGPPVAVKRFQNPSFPQRFRLGPADRMIESTPFRGPFVLTARLDSDGNVTTRESGDLTASAPGSVATGARGVILLLSAQGQGP